MNPTVSAPAKILLIDANVFLARRITEALKLEGFEVVHTTQSGCADNAGIRHAVGHPVLDQPA